MYSMPMDRKDVARLASAILLCELVGGLGSVFAIPSISTWYAGLAKPAFSPPNWVFGPVWILLYLLMGVSLYLVWSRGAGNPRAAPALKAFGLQLSLNLLWSLLFFGLRSTAYGLVDIVFLWVAVLVTLLRFRKISSAASWVLVPYLLWVTFASLLNFYVFVLN